MNKHLAVAVSTVAALGAFLLTLFVELIAFASADMAISYRAVNGGSIGWDPVSLWHQGLFAKLVIACIVLVPFILPVVAARFAYRFTYSTLRVKQLT